MRGKTLRMSAASAMVAVGAMGISTFAWAQAQGQDTRRDDTRRQQQQTQDRQNRDQWNQNQDQNQNMRRQGDRAMQGHAMAKFLPISEMVGTNVYNAADEDLGEVEDLLTVNGSGEIRFVVVETGQVLGMGGRHILIPYHAFHWDAANERLLLDATPDRLERLPDFNEEEWGLVQKGRRGRLSDFLRGESANEREDEYRDRIGDARTIALKGTVQSVQRRETDSGREQVVLSLNTNDQGTQEIILGPSWYVTRSAAAPMRGQQAEVVAWKTGGGELIAQRATIGGEQLALRNDRGEATWSGRTGETGPLPGYFLTDDLDGADVYCQDKQCGDVADVIVEVNSGRVAFLSIDPDENFLGMADTKRMVPWTLASFVGDNKIRIDATRDMILKSVKTPDNYDDFASSNQYKTVYTAYGIEPRTFDRNDMDRDQRGFNSRDHEGMGGGPAKGPGRDDMNQARGGAWSDPQFLQAMQSGVPSTISGKVVQMTAASPSPNMGEGQAVIIETGSGQRQTVLLGPADMVKRSQIQLREGDQVTIDARKFEYNGKSHVIAYNVRQRNGESMPLWGGRQPAPNR